MRIIAVWLLLCSVTFAQVPQAVEEVSESVGLLFAENGAGGSCVYIGDRYALTANHVLEGKTGYAKWGSIRVKAKQLAGEVDTDQAIIELEEAPSIKAAKLAKLESYRDHKLYCIGFDHADASKKRIFFGDVDEVRINAEVTPLGRILKGKDNWIYIVKSPATPGNSGGGVFNYKGEVLCNISAKTDTETFTTGYVIVHKLLEGLQK